MVARPAVGRLNFTGSARVGRIIGEVWPVTSCRSLGELARLSGVSKQTLSKIEKGSGNPTVEILAMVSTGLDVSPRRLLTEWGYAGPSATELRGHLAAPGRDVHEAAGPTLRLYVRSVLRLERARRRTRSRRPPGALHDVYLISGKLRTGPLREPIDLPATSPLPRRRRTPARLPEPTRRRPQGHDPPAGPAVRRGGGCDEGPTRVRSPSTGRPARSVTGGRPRAAPQVHRPPHRAGGRSAKSIPA
jgi:transcriptional regulator with XRE-family HTH domain